MLPILLGVAAAFVGYGMNRAAREINEETEWEIESVNKSMEELIKKTKTKAENTKKRCDEALKKLNNQKEALYNTTMTKFTETASKIKNIDFDNTISEAQKIKAINLDNLSYKSVESNSLIVSLSQLPEPIAVLVSPGLLGQFAAYCKLDDKLQEAQAEKAKLEAQCEMIKKECTKINSITKLCKTTYDTIDALKQIADKAVDEMGEIINTNGTNYMSYSEWSQNQIWFTFNLIAALSDLTNTEITSEDGVINKDFKKFVGEVNAQYLEEANE